MTVSQTRRLKLWTETRQKILNSALDQFSKEGYEKVSLHKIAANLGYTPAAIYRYFDDKKDIFYKLYLEGFLLLQKYQQRSRHILDPTKRLETHCQDYIKFAFEHREFYDIMFLLQAPIKKLMDKTDWRRVTSRTILHFRQDVQAILQKHHSDSEVNIAMLTVWSALHGLISLTIRDRLMPDTKYLRTTIHHMIDMLVHTHTRSVVSEYIIQSDNAGLTSSIANHTSLLPGKAEDTSRQHDISISNIHFAQSYQESDRKK